MLSITTCAGNYNFFFHLQKKKKSEKYFFSSISCQEPFEGAEGNLRRTIANYSTIVKDKGQAQRCVAELLSLLHLWESDPHNADKINQLCKELLCDIESCFAKDESDGQTLSGQCSIIADEASIDGYLLTCRNEQVTTLSEAMIFQKVVVCLMLIWRLQAKESNESHSVIAFVLAVFSQLVQFTSRNLQEAYLLRLPENFDCNDNDKPANGHGETNGNAVNGRKREKKSLLTKLRRRRTRESNSDSETSDLEESVERNSSCDSDEANSDVSETEEDALSDGNLSEEEGDNNIVNLRKSQENNNLEADNDVSPKESNGTADTADKVRDSMALIKRQRSSASDVFDVISEESLLATIKVCCDWLRNNQAIIKMCAKTSRILLKNLTTLLNLINLNSEELLDQWSTSCDGNTLLTSHEKIVVLTQTVPLPEDIELKVIIDGFIEMEMLIQILLFQDLKFLDQAQKNLDWNFLRKQRMSKREETLLRVSKLVNFGHFLSAISECKIKYHFGKKLFVIQEAEKVSKSGNEPKTVKNLDRKKGKLMRHMGKLWLKAEVKALESRLHANLMSPYLVPDHEALAKHMPALKRLVYAKKFIVIVPSVGEN